MIATLASLSLVALSGHVQMITDEPRVVLQILAIERKGNSVPDQDWSKLFATDGYQRLKQREHGMKRKFEDDDFKKFVQSPELIARAGVLAKTLEDWSHADVRECQRRALAYLPKGADITAKVYLLIKPIHNSFVWDVEKDPAIMLYLDPANSREAFVGTVAHEMHHIGYGRSCPSPEFKKWLGGRSQALKTAYMWLGAFGEGFAVLAAADGMGHDPQAWASADVRKDWADGMAHQPEQFAKVESYFLKVLSGEYDDTKANEEARAFFGIVGPWYTVGYTMATSIEKAYDRDKLIACYRDPRHLLSTYNDAAKELGQGRPLWSTQLIDAMK